MRKNSKIEKTCDNCLCSFTRSVSELKKNKSGLYYCSYLCYRKYVAKNNSHPRGMKDKNHTKTSKDKMSKSRKGLPKSNLHKTKMKQVHALRSYEDKKKLYAKVRRSNENSGYWRNVETLHEKELYDLQTEWKFSVVKFISDKDQLDLLNKYGMYNTIDNISGVVRDHKYSRASGFFNSVYPELLRHPCNCEIMLNSDNVKKRTKNSIELEDLFKNIEKFSSNWPEQEICLDLLKKYRNGSRWKKENQIE